MEISIVHLFILGLFLTKETLFYIFEKKKEKIHDHIDVVSNFMILSSFVTIFR